MKPEVLARLKIESEELQIKIDKLADYNERVYHNTGHSSNLVHKQWETMVDYQGVLLQRISLAERGDQ